jgi:hypothetical protein
VVVLQEDRALFARMMMACKNHHEIYSKEAVGPYEFYVVPRLLFAANGTMLYCSTKSNLMDSLEKYKVDTYSDSSDGSTGRVPHRVDVIDGMTALQSLDKPNG